MHDGRIAAYDIAAIQARVRAGRLVIPRRVARDAKRQQRSERDITAVICSLTPDDLHKSSPHLSRPGVWLDIYRPRCDLGRLYVKLTLHENGVDVLVLSFCRDGEAH